MFAGLRKPGMAEWHFPKLAHSVSYCGAASGPLSGANRKRKQRRGRAVRLKGDFQRAPRVRRSARQSRRRLGWGEP